MGKVPGTPASESNDEVGPACVECGFGIHSLEHTRGKDMQGRGLHGHVQTTKAEADEQRAEVMRRAHEEAAAAHKAWLADVVKEG